MKRTLAFVALLLLPVPSPPLSTRPSCSTAEAFAAERLFAKAREEYSKLLTADPKMACALSGFSATAEAQRSAQISFLRAQDFESLKDWNAARSAYEEAIRTDRSHAAVEALASLEERMNGVSATPSPPAFAAAEALLDAGYEEDARKEVPGSIKEALKEDPDARIPASLEYSNAGTWFEGAAETVASFLKWFAAVFSVLFLIFILLLLSSRREGAKSLRRWYLIRWFYKSQKVVTEFESFKNDFPLGASITAMINAEIQQATGAGVSLERVTADSSVDIDFSEVLPALKPFAPLMKPVFRRERQSLSGRVLLPKKEGPGIFLSIADAKGSIMDSLEIFETVPGFDAAGTDTAPYYELVPLAAAWAIFSLGDADELCGTKTWSSYGYFRQGVKKNKAGRASYLKALERDSRNLGATINLAQLEMREPERFTDAIERLEPVLSSVQKKSADPWSKRAEIPIRYLLAVTYLHRYLYSNRPDSPSDLIKARDYGIDLVSKLANSLIDLYPARPKEGARPRTDKEKQFWSLYKEEPKALIMLAHIQHILHAPNRNWPCVQDTERWERLKAMSSETAPSGEELVQLIPEARLTPGSRYNLACYKGGRRDFDGCMAELARALELLPDHVAWARSEDPALADLRRDPEWGPRLKSLADRLSPPETPVEIEGAWTLTVPG
jgi:tetratricopeptide (TPR) repeat protein